LGGRRLARDPFFVAGLELKRELVAGDFAGPRRRPDRDRDHRRRIHDRARLLDRTTDESIEGSIMGKRIVVVISVCRCYWALDSRPPAEH
jgi:hypothetical protein